MKSSQLQYELELQEVKIKNIAKKNNLHMKLIYKIIQKFSDELTEIEQKIDFRQNGSSKLEKVTNEAIIVSKNLSSKC